MSDHLIRSKQWWSATLDIATRATEPQAHSQIRHPS